MRRPSPARAGSLVMGAVLAAGCSSSGEELPSVTDFRAGDCQKIAADVLTIARDAGGLGTAGAPPQSVRDSLKTAQDRIRAVAPSLGADLTAPVQALVEAVGVVRLRSDAKGYAPSLGTELATASRQVISLCTPNT